MNDLKKFGKKLFTMSVVSMTIAWSVGLSALVPAGGGVNFRPGARLVKSAVSPSVFAVGPDNMKHKIADEKVAAALYGSAWSKLVRVIPDVFDSNYKVGAELKEAKLHDGQLVMKSGDTTVYYVWMGMLKKVDGTLPSQTSGDVRTVSVETFFN